MRKRTAQSAAKLVLAEDGVRQAGYREEAFGVSGFIAEELEEVAVKDLAARLGDDIDYPASGLFELGGCKCALNPELGHRLHQRHDGDRERVAVGVVSAVQNVTV